ncbi:MAG: alginate export family protein, partial [Gemmatimonadetes bacterium]|nr:alginate export family protein [Gemmatimonadota bacterium]
MDPSFYRVSARSRLSGGLWAALLVTAAISYPAGPAAAESPVLRWDGHIRVRTATSDRTFMPDAAVRNSTELRSRFGVGTTVKSNATVYIQLQDSRVLGGEGATGEPTSGTLNDGHNVDLHQAWLRVTELIGPDVGLRAGRFEVNTGNQRVFGSVGWHNVGRSWEGITLETRPAEDWKADFHWLKRLELDDPAENRDFDVLLANVACSHGLEVFGVLEKDADAAPGSPARLDALRRWTTGVYARHDGGSWDIEANLAHQGGDKELLVGTTLVEQEISANLVTAEIGVPLNTRRPARLAAGVDYASGDSSPGAGKFSAYDNLYYTGHKFRGYMDYFLASGTDGLVDWMARASFQPADRWTAKLDWHLFRTAVDRPAFDGGMTKDVG